MRRQRLRGALLKTSARVLLGGHRVTVLIGRRLSHDRSPELTLIVGQ
jgi:hypothetical protein